MGQLQGITVDIEGARTLADFEVIEIVDDRNPYPVLLGIDWTTNMNGVQIKVSPEVVWGVLELGFCNLEMFERFDWSNSSSLGASCFAHFSALCTVIYLSLHNPHYGLWCFCSIIVTHYAIPLCHT